MDQNKLDSSSTSTIFAEHSLQEDITKELECVICLEKYIDPKVLECLHTFCCKCLQDCLKNGEIICPSCRRATQVISGDVSLLKSNFFITSMLDVLEFHSKTVSNDVKCTTCENSSAFKFCKECDRFLCKSCLAAHQQFVNQCKLSDIHQLLTLDEAKRSISQKLGATKRHCLKHKDEPLKLFCNKCEEVICRDCALVEHKRHDYAFIPQVCDKYRVFAKMKLNSAMQTISVTSVTEKFEAKIKEIEILGKCCKQEVTLKLNDIIDKARRQRDLIMNTIHSKTEDLITLLRRQIEEVHMVKSDAASLDDILQKWEGIEILGISRQLVKRIEEIEQFQVNTDLLKRTFTIDETQSDENAISEHIASLFSLSDADIRMDLPTISQGTSESEKERKSSEIKPSHTLPEGILPMQHHRQQSALVGNVHNKYIRRCKRAIKNITDEQAQLMKDEEKILSEGRAKRGKIQYDDGDFSF